MLTALSAFLVLSARPAHAKAGIPIIWSSGSEKIVKVADFPDTGVFQGNGGELLDPGYKFKQVQLFFLPVWNYGGEWCAYVGKDDTYMEMSKATLDSIAKTVNVTLPESPSLGFWNSIGGKLVLGLALAAGAAWLFTKSDA
ncbi:MAG TPA: hypothetical protein PKO15_13510 [Fibrobacteria bacterium]|nr:hypothetical protein [Fibrobacteria bacterium]HOX51604.1 hypothetical protein [Fibrobacteria bacterium]